MNTGMSGIRIINTAHLELLLNGRKSLDCFVQLRVARSSKTIYREDDGMFRVYNEIDNTFEVFNSLQELMQKHETIRKAHENGAFYVYEYEVPMALRKTP